MRYLFAITILILFVAPFNSRGQQTEPAKPTLYLRGYILGADTNNTIPLANILKNPTGERYVSNRYGAFGIKVQETDTLVFSVIGYQTLTLPMKEYVLKNMTDPIRVKLKPATYKLKQAEVTFNKKRRDSIARQAAVIMKNSPLLNDYHHVDSWIAGSSGSPITELFSTSNKKLQEYYKLQRLMALYHEQELVDNKYTDDLIIRSTGIDKKKIPELKKFCNLPHYFILNATDYDLIMAIKSCYTDYLNRDR